MEDAELDLTEFVKQLRLLCNEFGVELIGCDCLGIIVAPVIKPIEEFEIEELEGNVHLMPIYAKMILTV